MPKILFTSSPKIPHDKAEEWVGYLIGTVHDVSLDEAERWLRRGSCEIITTRQANLILKEEVKGEEVAPPPPPPTISAAKVETKVDDGKVVDISKGTTTSPPTTPTTPALDGKK